MLCDCYVARDEWIAKYGNDELFDAYDLNGDGVIDGNPLQALVTRSCMVFAADEFIAGQMAQKEFGALDGKTSCA